MMGEKPKRPTKSHMAGGKRVILKNLGVPESRRVLRVIEREAGRHGASFYDLVVVEMRGGRPRVKIFDIKDWSWLG